MNLLWDDTNRFGKLSCYVALQGLGPSQGASVSWTWVAIDTVGQHLWSGLTGAMGLPPVWLLSQAQEHKGMPGNRLCVSFSSVQVCLYLGTWGTIKVQQLGLRFSAGPRLWAAGSWYYSHPLSMVGESPERRYSVTTSPGGMHSGSEPGTEPQVLTSRSAGWGARQPSELLGPVRAVVLCEVLGSSNGTVGGYCGGGTWSVLDFHTPQKPWHFPATP
jgi:hypothetical protein